MFPHSSDLQPIPNPTAQQTRIQRSSHVGMPCRLRPTTHSLRSLSSAGGVVLRLVVCGVVLVVSRVVWCCSCCVFVCVTCFLLYPTAQHPNPDGDGHCSAAEEFGVCRYALPPLTRDPFLSYSATDASPDDDRPCSAAEELNRVYLWLARPEGIGLLEGCAGVSEIFRGILRMRAAEAASFQPRFLQVYIRIYICIYIYIYVYICKSIYLCICPCQVTPCTICDFYIPSSSFYVLHFITRFPSNDCHSSNYSYSSHFAL